MSFQETKEFRASSKRTPRILIALLALKIARINWQEERPDHQTLLQETLCPTVT